MSNQSVRVSVPAVVGCIVTRSDMLDLSGPAEAHEQLISECEIVLIFG